MTDLRQSTFYTRTFFIYQTASPTLGLTGAAPVVKLSKAGATGVTATNSPATEVDATNNPGLYKIALTMTDTNTVGDLAFTCTAASGNPNNFIDQVKSQIFTDLVLDASGHAIIAAPIRQGQPWNGFMFEMTVGDPPVPTPGLTVTAQRNLAGAGWSPCAFSPTDLGLGSYAINLAGTDTNAPFVLFKFTAPGANELDILQPTQP